jgi:hypothetical protein
MERATRKPIATSRSLDESRRRRWGGGSGWVDSGVSIARQGALVSIGISDCVPGGVRRERYRSPITVGLWRAYPSLIGTSPPGERPDLFRP